jgi:hypothetical protein
VDVASVALRLAYAQWVTANTRRRLTTLLSARDVDVDALWSPEGA